MFLLFLISFIQSRRYHRKHRSRNYDWSAYVDFTQNSNDRIVFKEFPKYGRVLTLKNVNEHSFTSRNGKSGITCSFYDSRLNSILLHSSFLKNYNSVLTENEILSNLGVSRVKSFFLSLDSTDGYRQRFRSNNGIQVSEEKMSMTNPDKLNYYFYVTKKGDFNKTFVKGFRGTSYVKEIINKGNKVLKELNRGNRLVILQSTHDDLSTAVSVYVHAKRKVLNMNEQDKVYYIKKLLENEIYNERTRLYYDGKYKDVEIHGKNAVFLSLIAALSKNIYRNAFLLDSDIEYGHMVKSKDFREIVGKILYTRGIPNKYRSLIWPRLANVEEMKKQYVYKNYTKEECNIKEPIDRDVYYGTGVGSKTVFSQEMKDLTSRIIHNYAKTTNTIYLQGMHLSAALLAMHLNNELDIFYTYVSIMESNYTNLKFYHHDQTGIKDSHLFVNLLLNVAKEKMIPIYYNQLYTYFKGLSKNIDQIFSVYLIFPSEFSPNLFIRHQPDINNPHDFTGRCMDAYLCYGERFEYLYVCYTLEHFLEIHPKNVPLDKYIYTLLCGKKDKDYLLPRTPKEKDKLIKRIIRNMISEERFEELRKIAENNPLIPMDNILLSL